MKRRTAGLRFGGRAKERIDEERLKGKSTKRRVEDAIGSIVVLGRGAVVDKHCEGEGKDEDESHEGHQPRHPLLRRRRGRRVRFQPLLPHPAGGLQVRHIRRLPPHPRNSSTTEKTATTQSGRREDAARARLLRLEA